MATIAEALALALQHHQGNNFPEAERIYRLILEADPANADALHLLGMLFHQAGEPQQALDYLRQAVSLNPREASFHCDLGLVHQAQGRLEEAVACYRHAVQLRPQYAEAHYNLGIALREQGRLEEAVACYRQALHFRPHYPKASYNLGNVLRDQGQLQEAVACFRQAVSLCPEYPEAHHNLGSVLKEQGRLDEAAACFRQALQLRPNYPKAHRNLALILRDQGELDEAIACYRQALHLQPDDAEAHNNLGIALRDQGRLEEGAASFRAALGWQPDYPEAHNNLGVTLTDLEVLDEAASSFRQALRLRPAYPEASYNLGIALRKQGQLDEAVASYRRALELRPNYPEAHQNLGNALKDQGRLDEAIACYRRAEQLQPEEPAYHSNLLLCLMYHPGYDEPALVKENRRWEQQHARALAPAAHVFANDPSPERRLRIGYVSPDFRAHVVGHNFWPLLRTHDHGQLEITLYANVSRADAMTEQFRGCADHWCPIAGWPDDRVAARIRQDGIDILVDLLALHTAGNRLRVFARKPAPVQVTWAGYAGTTVLSAIDYRLTDPYLDPPGGNEERDAEACYRLPHSFWCYDPESEEPGVASLPALEKGYITFGCLNNFCKVNDEVLALWARVLREVPGARLHLLAKQGSHRGRTLAFLAEQDIAPERVEFFSPRPGAAYLALYHQLDIGLDTSPYNGHTTSLDSLWMGVPVLTLVGKTLVGRGGLSQLTNLGLEELAAFTPDSFVRLAVDLACDLPRLQALRTGLRGRMKQSPLMDVAGFARGIEQAYRVMWRRWCAGTVGHPQA